MTTTTEESVLNQESETELREDDEVEGEGAQAEADEGAGEADPPVVEEGEQGTEGEATTGEEGTPATPADTAKPTGVLSKDGKHVLPYAALHGSRREAKANSARAQAAEAKNAQLEQEIADLRAGKKPLADGLTPEQIEELSADFPAMAPVLTQMQKDREELKALRTSKAAPAAQPDAGSSPIQDAIDTVPLLVGWQAAGDEKWQRAVAIDNALKDSPKWRGKPEAERFQHVARMVADEFDIAVDDEPKADPSPKQISKPNKARQAPADVIRNAARTAPNTLSDFKGGAPDPSRESIDRMPAARQVTKFEAMSDAEIDAHLAKFG